MHAFTTLTKAIGSKHHKDTVGHARSNNPYISKPEADKSTYVPSERFPAPYVAVCISALAGDTNEEAIRQSRTRDHWRIGFGRNQRNPLVHPDKLPAADYTAEEFENISKWHAKAIVGTADQIEEKLSSMAKQHGIDEFVINTWTYDFESRVRSYQLLSKLIK
jgi:alkanesulfonate monooxygenase SsuD/methylene tetrahydromethanopterin reductase-like flavin-dependent oxidoreductase (luciferase family)